MSASILKAAFDPFFPAPIQAWEDFASKCETKTYPKEQVLKEADTNERFFYFMIKGSAGVFLWKEYNFVCLDFVFENYFFCDYMSILTGNPTPLQIMTLEESTVLRISRENFLDLGKEGMGSFIMRMAAESSYILKQQQQIDLLTKTAEQRYLEILRASPEVIQRVAQRHLASYLGITPQSLSRIRRKVR